MDMVQSGGTVTSQKLEVPSHGAAQLSDIVTDRILGSFSLPLRHRFLIAKKSFKIRRFSNRRLLAVEHHGGAPPVVNQSYIGWRILPSPSLFRDLDFRSAVGGRAYDLFGVHWLTDRTFRRGLFWHSVAMAS